jgi:beta-glucosidase
MSTVLAFRTHILMQEKQHGFIGLSIYGWWFVPLTDTKEDAIATQRAFEFFIGW